MAAALKALDRWVSDRRDVQKRNIAHAIKGRMHPSKGYAWLSERLLLRDICRCSWSEGSELIGELIAAGEFYRVTARGPGCGKGRTLYFYGWARRQLLEQELTENRMPLAAFHHVDRCLEDYRQRLSFFHRFNDAGEHRHRVPQEGLTTRKDARTTRGHPSRASPDPPRSANAAPPDLRTTPGGPESTTDGLARLDDVLARLDDVPEDLRYLYPKRFPDAIRPTRLKGRSGQLEPLNAVLPKRFGSAAMSRKPADSG